MQANARMLYPRERPKHGVRKLNLRMLLARSKVILPTAGMCELVRLSKKAMG